MPPPPSTTSRTNSPENDPVRTEHIKGRYNLGAAFITGILGAVVGVVGLLTGQSQGKIPVPTPQPTTTVTVTQTATPSAGGESSTDPSEPPQVLISAAIGNSDTVGKDKALACVQPKTHCLWLVPSVIGQDGPMDVGCNLTWQLVTDGGLGSLIEQGRAFRCNSGFYVGNDKAMPAGTYRLKLAVETDAGDKYAGQYDFTLVSE